VNGLKRRGWLPAAGFAVMLAAPPLTLVSQSAFLAVWYAGVALVLAWLITDGRRPG
jgi:hypothetical protein